MSGVIKRNPDYYKLNSTDRILALSGVPLQVLARKFTTATNEWPFQNVIHKVGSSVVSVAPDSQLKCYMNLEKQYASLGESVIYGIASHPTEQTAYDFAVTISRGFYNAAIKEKKIAKIQWCDLGAPDWDFLKGSQEIDLTIIHGVSEASEPRRFELARDFLHRSYSGTKILVAAHQNILSLMVDRIQINPDAIFQLGRKVTRRIGVG